MNSYFYMIAGAQRKIERREVCNCLLLKKFLIIFSAPGTSERQSLSCEMSGTLHWYESFQLSPAWRGQWGGAERRGKFGEIRQNSKSSCMNPPHMSSFFYLKYYHIPKLQTGPNSCVITKTTLQANDQQL